MNNKDFENLEQIKRILKYLDKGKLDTAAWPNTLDLIESLNKLLIEHEDFMEHMKKHH